MKLLPLGLGIAVAVWASAPSEAQMTPQILAAQQQGIVGERYDGYLGFARHPSDLVRRQVAAVNIKRRSLYTDLAHKRDAFATQVGITAGCQLLSTVGVGQVYMLNDGKWRTRSAGEPAPVPNYCGR